MRIPKPPAIRTSVINNRVRSCRNMAPTCKITNETMQPPPMPVKRYPLKVSVHPYACSVYGVPVKSQSIDAIAGNGGSQRTDGLEHSEGGIKGELQIKHGDDCPKGEVRIL